MNTRPLDWIGIVEPKTGRVSSIGIYGRDGSGLKITGVLPHGSEIVPRTIADADKLIAWLQEWKAEISTKGQ